MGSPQAELCAAGALGLKRDEDLARVRGELESVDAELGTCRADLGRSNARIKELEKVGACGRIPSQGARVIHAMMGDESWGGRPPT